MVPVKSGKEWGREGATGGGMTPNMAEMSGDVSDVKIGGVKGE